MAFKEVKLYDLDYSIIPECTRVVCVCKYKDKWVFAKHKDRDTWELPGGHIEQGEDFMTAGKRELFEETGATRVKIQPICLYSVSTYGLLCYAEIEKLEKLPDFEIAQIGLFDDIPLNLTYSFHKMFFDKVKSVIENKNI